MRDETGVRAPEQLWRHHCVECGQPFPSWYYRGLTCSRRCAMRRWRTYTMLVGTHGFVKGRFQRLVNAAD
jgi:hypothetical protein